MYQIVNDLSWQAENIQWIEFELSNNCQYADYHSWCPRHYDKRELTFLPASIVVKTIHFFKKFSFSGMIYLSGYSEPLIDPRFLLLVQFIKENLPKCCISMFSNGLAADENLLSDALNCGVDIIRLSIYSKEEGERLSRISQKINSPRIILHPRYDKSISNEGSGEGIDCRLNVYDEPQKGIEEPCFIPSMYYFVRNNGDVNMCFWDWKYTQVFGNLFHDSVEKTLMNSRRLEINDFLVNNRRNLVDVCSRCSLPAQRCISEYQSRLKLKKG